MKNIKNTFNYDYSKSTKNHNKRKTQSISRVIAEEKINFKDGAELGSLPIAIEDGVTKRKVRRIVEKRVCKEYWKSKKNAIVVSNKQRSDTKRYVSCVTKIIFGVTVAGFHYVAA